MGVQCACSNCYIRGGIAGQFLRRHQKQGMCSRLMAPVYAGVDEQNIRHLSLLGVAPELRGTLAPVYSS